MPVQSTSGVMSILFSPYPSCLKVQGDDHDFSAKKPQRGGDAALLEKELFSLLSTVEKELEKTRVLGSSFISNTSSTASSSPSSDISPHPAESSDSSGTSTSREDLHGLHTSLLLYRRTKLLERVSRMRDPIRCVKQLYPGHDVACSAVSGCTEEPTEDRLSDPSDNVIGCCPKTGRILDNSDFDLAKEDSFAALLAG